MSVTREERWVTQPASYEQRPELLLVVLVFFSLYHTTRRENIDQMGQPQNTTSIMNDKQKIKTLSTLLPLNLDEEVKVWPWLVLPNG